MLRKRDIQFLGGSVLIHLGLLCGFYFFGFFSNHSSSGLGSGTSPISWVHWEGSGVPGGGAPGRETAEEAALKKVEKVEPEQIPNPKKTKKINKSLVSSKTSLASKRQLILPAASDNAPQSFNNSSAESRGEDSGNGSGGSGAGEGGPGQGGNRGGGFGLGSGTGNELAKIKKSIYRKVYRAQTMLRQRHYEGALSFILSLHPDGSIQNLQISKSSGNTELDQNALDLVRKEAPFPYYPKPLEYHLTCLRE